MPGAVGMSRLEDVLEFHLTSTKAPVFEREYQFHPTRKWRFDFAWPDALLAVECEGGTWTGGRHTTGSGFEADCEKYNEAALRGWTVLRYTMAMIKSGVALQQIEAALKQEKPE
jgi:very-short-patch-repair endonuclease